MVLMSFSENDDMKRILVLMNFNERNELNMTN